MTTVASTGTAPVRRQVVVPAMGTAAVDPTGGSTTTATATSFTFAGGGVTATQSVGSAAGWDSAPCASRVSSQWAFAGGSTTAGNSLTLSLFDPTAAPAMVNVSFLTVSGAVLTPQAYQGLTIAPGQLVDEQVGTFVQDQPTVATLVSSASGSLVATELQQQTVGSSTGLSLELGSPAPETTWHFAQTTATTKGAVDFTLANPGTSPVTVQISVGLPSATVVPRRVVIPAMAATVFDASSMAGWPQGTAYAVTVEAPAPIVVGRSVLAPPGAQAPGWGASSGSSSPSTGWLVIGPGVPGAPAVAGATVRTLAVADPGGSPASVVVTVLGGAARWHQGHRRAALAGRVRTLADRWCRSLHRAVVRPRRRRGGRRAVGCAGRGRRRRGVPSLLSTASARPTGAVPARGVPIRSALPPSTRGGVGRVSEKQEVGEAEAREPACPATVRTSAAASGPSAAREAAALRGRGRRHRWRCRLRG